MPDVFEVLDDVLREIDRLRKDVVALRRSLRGPQQASDPTKNDRFVREWVENCTRLRRDAVTPRQNILDAFNQWSIASGREPMSARSFFPRLKRVLGENAEHGQMHGGVRVVRGLDLDNTF